METEIIKKLKDIGSKYGVKVLYACETGSRAWGFPSPDSDYDVRMIYMHGSDWYLSLGEGTDSIEVMDGDLDITGWDIRKSLRLLWKSNEALLERLQSPIVYHEEPGFTEACRKVADRCFSPVATMHHYLGMARTSFADVEGQDEIKLKKLFYSLRAALACKWILEKDSIPPIVFKTMVDELAFDEDLKSRIRELVELKSGKPESYMHPAETALNQLISEQLRISENSAKDLRGRQANQHELDELFRSILKKY